MISQLKQKWNLGKINGKSESELQVVDLIFSGGKIHAVKVKFRQKKGNSCHSWVARPHAV